MNNTTFLGLLKNKFEPSVCLVWFIFGSIVGVIAWIWGTSKIPGYLLQFFSGVSFLTLLMVLVTLIFSILVLKSKARLKKLAKGDVDNFSPFVIKSTFKTACILFSIAIVATLSWMVTNSSYALGSAIYGLVLGIPFLFIWMYLLSIENDVNNQT